MELENNIANLINESRYENSFIAEQIGISMSVFSAKMQAGKWTESEIKQISLIIENEKFENYFIIELMEAAKDEPSYPNSPAES